MGLAPLARPDGPAAGGAPVLIPAIGADGRLYPIEKLRAHREAVLHLAVSVFVFAGDKLLIQRRARAKYHCGGLWANTCCSHPHWDEQPHDAAHRRLGEELGLSLPLTHVGEVEYSADVGGGLHEHERVSMFVAMLDDPDEVHPRPDPEEVMDWRWVSVAALHEEMAAAPEEFTPWFRIYAERFPDLSRLAAGV